VRRRLRTLALWHNDVQDWIVGAALHYAMRPEERVDLALWRRAYLGRYLRFQPSEVDGFTLRESWRFIELVGELIEKENHSVTTANEDR
jgi:hypothetical protein